MDGIWTGVRERVLALREAPGRTEVFGAESPRGGGHGFELLPVLTEAEVRAVERSLAVELPAEYRSFLLEVGAGGAGPDYGLFPLRPPGPDTPPSPEPPFRPELTAELESGEPERDDYADEAAFLAAYQLWDARADELHDALTDGTLCIGERGCAYYNLLVINGPHLGTVWEDVRAVGEGVVPLRLPGGTGPVPFARWYLNWLHHAERRAWDTAAGAPPRPRATDGAA
ncbi:SMI1/KNR4 family protein [Streptomyces pactum]|uniref:SMI1/KNR4 family protein n=1 Tax=Streptomyces pactum TaxID=68249 RepID=A0ABS0NJN4_9ACTN|nr:SMI1/KNR4 family protein [Streptomyces pactum]MBH5335410.1 SMI1/KNR4 family protein [Streptomyces pactum]